MKEMPLQSLLRVLGKITSNKVLEPGSSETQAVCERIKSETALTKVGPYRSSYSCVFVFKHESVFKYLMPVVKSPGEDPPFQHTVVF